MKNARLKIINGVKMLRSEDYNYNFRLKDGLFQRWGKTEDDDPEFSPFGPEIMDIEISYGDTCSIRCNFCSPPGTIVNTPGGKTPIEKITKGDLVIGFDTEKNTPKVQDVKEIYSRSYKGELICIEMEDGQVLKLTPDHEIYTKNRGWILSKELNENDEIVSF